MNCEQRIIADVYVLMKTSPMNDTSDVSRDQKTVTPRKKTEPTSDMSRELKTIIPRKKNEPTSKKIISKKIRKQCMFRVHGEVEFTKENKAILKPDITCSKIVNGKKMFNRGNVICNTCGKCFCSPFMKDRLEKYAMERNCFEKHKELDGSVCKDADFTPLVQMTREEYNRKCKNIREKYNKELKKEKFF